MNHGPDSLDRSFRYRLHVHLNRLTRGWIDHPDTLRMLQSWRERDPEANHLSTPPEDQHIEIIWVWACEFYVPSNISSLERGLQILYRDKSSFHQDPIEGLRSHSQS